MSLILLDPAPTEGGGTSPAPTSPALAEQTPAPQVVPVPIAAFQDLMSLQGRLAQVEAENKARLQAEQDKAVQAALKAGQAEEAVRTVRTQLETERDQERQARLQAEGRSRAYARDTALAQELAAHKLVPGAAAQLMRLIRDDLEAYPEGDGYAVRTKEFKPTKAYVAEVLARPEYQHFIEPTSRGGGGPTPPGAHPTADPTARPADRMGEQLKATIGRDRHAAPGLTGNYANN